MKVPLFISVYNRQEMARECIESARENPDIGEIHVLDTGVGVQSKSFDVYHHEIAHDGWAHDAHRAAPKICDGEFYLFADSDEEIIGDISHMIDAIRQEDDIGGVGSPLIEDDRIFYMGDNFKEKGNEILRDGRQPIPEMRWVNGFPFAEFDLISTCAVYRVECLEDYTWDDRYKMGHAQGDFHLGHWKNTDWNFLLSLTPVYRHKTGGKDSLENKRSSRRQESLEMFLDKWGYDSWDTRTPWMSSNYEPRDDLGRLVMHYRQGGISRVIKRIIKKIL